MPFFIQNKLHWYIYRILRGHTVSGKLPKISLFGPSLTHQLRLLGSQQHPQSGVLLTSFSTWGTENSLAEINLESTGVLKGHNISFWSKIGKHLQLCGWAHYRVENFSPTSSRSPDHPAHSKSLYRLCYPGPTTLRVGVVHSLSCYPLIFYYSTQC